MGPTNRDKEEVYLNGVLRLETAGFIIFVHTSSRQSYEVQGRAGGEMPGSSLHSTEKDRCKIHPQKKKGERDVK